MAALLAGARLVLQRGGHPLPLCARRPCAVLPLRCLSASSRFFTVIAQEKRSVEAAPVTRFKMREGVWSVNQIGYRLKKNGRVRKVELLNSFSDVCKAGKPSSGEAWFFLRACGSYMPEVPLAERTEVADFIWNKLKEMGVPLTITHYNTLLEVYLQNEHVFSPTDFLATMEAAGLEPDQDTYHGLIAAYCAEGDLDSASKILGYMKSKNFPITEVVFNSLIKGHAKVGDLESAMNVFSIMQSAGTEPRWSTHLALINVYAERGDIQNIKQILNDHNVFVPQKHLTSVIMTLAKSGHSQYVPDVLEHMPNCENFSHDIVNLSLALLTQGYGDVAFEVAKLLNAWRPAQLNSMTQAADFFLRHCVALKLPVSTLNKFAAQFLAAEMHTNPKQYLLECALRTHNADMALEFMKTMTGDQLTPEQLSHQSFNFQPMLTYLHKKEDLQGLIDMMKAMRRLNIYVNLEVMSKVLPWIFSEANAGQDIMQDEKCLRDLQSICDASVRWTLRTRNPNSVLSFLHVTPTQVSKDRALAGAMAIAFLRNQNEADVRTLVKITGLLYKDGSDSTDSSGLTEFIGRFLYYVTDKMNDSQTQAVEEHLRQFLHQLKEMGLTLDAKSNSGIQKLLECDGKLELNKDLKQQLKLGARLMEPKQKLTSSAPFQMRDAETIAALEEQLANMKKDSEDFKEVLMQLLRSLRIAKDLPRALELKTKYEDVFTFSMYMTLFALCCEESVQEALKLKKEIDQKGFTEAPTCQKYIDFLKTLTENKLLEDAINILKEMQEKNIHMTTATDEQLFDILNNMAKREDVQGLNLIHEYSMVTGLIRPSSKMCSPLVMVHLKRNDLPAAANAISECIEKYNYAPLLHPVLVSLVEQGETDMIKRIVDLVSDVRGDQSMYHELLFAFLVAGKYSEAEKIVESSGLRAQEKKIAWFADRCYRLNQEDVMEKLVETTKNLSGCDRENLYYRLFKLYDKNNHWEKAKSVWGKMGEEKIVPLESTVNLLIYLFKRNGQDINVHIPELNNVSVSVSSESILDLCLEGKVTDAYAEFQMAEAENVRLTDETYTRLILALRSSDLKKMAADVDTAAKKHFEDYSLRNAASNLFSDLVRRNCLKDALVTLKAILENGVLPKQFGLRRLLTALALSGDMAGLTMIKELNERYEFLSDGILKNINFYVVLAHLKKGEFEEGLSLLENMSESDSKASYMSLLAGNLLQNNMEEALEKISIFAERRANQFADYKPITYLFLNYVKIGRDEAASHLLQRCSAIVEQRDMLCGYIARWLSGYKEENATRLVKLLADPCYNQALYSYKLRDCVVRKDVDAALEVYEQAKANNIEPLELHLKLLAILLRNAEKPVPFDEPPNTVEYYRQKLKQISKRDEEPEQEE